MRGVTSNEILAAIYRCRGKIIDACIRNGDKAFEYSFDDFRKDIDTTEILRDARTIRSKWTMLSNRGIVLTNRDTTSLSVLPFARMSYEARYGLGCEREINTGLIEGESE